jgi:alpha-D-ribose 1-methylphosphonate 5-triphosphate synthase subunit PhnL
MSTLEISALRKSFTQHLLGGAERLVLRSIDLEVEQGAFVVVAGPSGSGKSSLLRCVYRTYRPDAGSAVVRDNGRALDLAVADERSVLAARRELIGMAAQFLQVVPRLSALQLVVAEGLEAAEARERLLSLGLAAELADAPPATFSGGERQIVNLALALARRRPLILLDEVTASLDSVRRDRALRLLAEEKARGTTMLAVFHEPPKPPGLVDRVVRMKDGRVVA